MSSTIIIPRKSRVSLPVPSSYIGKQVEVKFVLIPETDKPKYIKTTQEKLINIQELILQSPTWTDEEYNDYLEVKTHINQSRLQ